MKIIRREFVFYGRVQHVGFRYMANLHAKERKLTGWVRNEKDGSVTLTVQGAEESVEGILSDLMHDRYIRILDYDIKCREVLPQETEFAVRR